VFAFNTVYWGPIWKNGTDYKLNSLQGIVDLNGKPQFIASDSLINKYGKEKILLAIDTFELQGKSSSNLIRKNLVLNGLCMIQQHPVMGLGPGQYSWYTKNNLVPYKTGTVDSPHEGLTELASQYGIPFTLYFIFVIGLTFLQFIKQKKINLFMTSQWVFCMGLFWIVAAMPSAWLVLNCGWILIAVLILSPEKEISASGN
jgi:O-antigen ligase